MKKRNSYSGKFKSKVALAAIENNKTIAELSSEYSIHSNLIRAWKKQLIAHSIDLFSDKRKEKEDNTTELIAELYKQIGQSKVEIDWLKKKYGILD